MTEAKNIKGIDEETWAQFKSLAAKSKRTASQMFKQLVWQYQEQSQRAWSAILSHKPVLSEKEYEQVEMRIKSARKEHGWRI